MGEALQYTMFSNYPRSSGNTRASPSTMKMMWLVAIMNFRIVDMVVIFNFAAKITEFLFQGLFGKHYILLSVYILIRRDNPDTQLLAFAYRHPTQTSAIPDRSFTNFSLLLFRNYDQPLAH